MKCSTCGSEMSAPTRTDGVRYPCGLRDVRLNGVLVHSCPGCGEKEVDVPNIAGLHRCLAEAVGTKPGRLAPDEIRFLRKHLGWSGADFARRFRTTPQTVTRWEKGEIKMKTQAELLLRVLAQALEPVREHPVPEALPDDHQSVEVQRIQRLLLEWDEEVEDPETPIALDLHGSRWESHEGRAACC